LDGEGLGKRITGSTDGEGDSEAGEDEDVDGEALRDGVVEIEGDGVVEIEGDGEAPMPTMLAAVA
jgi:hypothetical protein